MQSVIDYAVLSKLMKGGWSYPIKGAISSGSGGGVSLNIFTQLEEPETKEGIWIQTDNPHQNIVINNRILNEDGAWGDIGTLPYSFQSASAVVCNGEIHILGSLNEACRIYHYKFDGSTWTSVSTLPYQFWYGSAVVYNGEIHILGSAYSTYATRHYKFDGSTWTSVSTLPYDFSQGSAVVYNGEIHIIGGNKNRYGHYKFDGSVWTSVSTLPYQFYGGSAVVYNGEIHIVGNYGNYAHETTSHYKFDGSTWTSASTLPYPFYFGSAVVYNGEIHMLGSGYSGNYYYYHYKFDGSTWTSVSTLPYKFCYGSAITLNAGISILGATNEPTKHCTFTSSENMFDPNTIVMQRGDHLGSYVVCFVSTPMIVGDHNRFLSGFDDVWYFGESSFEMTAPMYYGDGTQWIKFKN